MNDKSILKIILKASRVKRAALLTEFLCTVSNYLNITENELKDIQWVNKKGQYEQMLSNQEITFLITNRELYLKDTAGTEPEKAETIKSISIFLSNLPVITDIMKVLTSPKKAGNIARDKNN